ncbi:MAG: elongation factor T [Gammaproteobacteria bacterium]|nr:MAG: elongation factor T [Gammaproteobacteria bacterium]TND07103.1 MAG: elongation factor T [Gammaproteobacteria bacterium]
MAIAAALVKELRERTGLGMMECKKALVETDGDIELAVEHLRKAGHAKADKKAGRIAADGLIVIATSEDGREAAMAEINSETDFVAKNDDFVRFANQVARRVLEKRPADLDALLATPLAAGDSKTVNTARQELIAKLGENINVRRIARLGSGSGCVGSYSHGSRIGVCVSLDKDDPDLAKDIAMHVAASRPVAISAADVPAEVIAKEREIYLAQAADSGKPADIIEKMVNGRVQKFLKETTLLGQPFVKDPDTTIEKLLKKSGASVAAFARYEIGEGIEKKEENFAAEVMAQAQGGR